MRVEKERILDKMKAKGLASEELAEKMQFDSTILKLYLAGDDYPIPSRIIKKIEEVLSA